MRIKPDTHGVRGAEHRRLTDPRNTGDRVLNGIHQIVAKVTRVQAAVIGGEAHHHEEARRGLLHLDAKAGHRFRQHGFSHRELVIHLNLSDISVRARSKRERHRHTAGAVRFIAHIDQAVETDHLLLNHLSNGVLQRFSRSARVVRDHRHLRRRDLRILRHRHGEDRQRASQHQHERDDPCKNRPVNKETRHFYFPRRLMRGGLSGCGRGRS